MKILIGKNGVGSNNESWYYIEYASDGNYYYIHEWNNMSHKLVIDEGEERLPLADAENKRIYKEALEAMENHKQARINS